MDNADGAEERTLAGRLVGVASRTDVSRVKVWFAYRPLEGAPVTVEAVSDINGEFLFELPLGSVGVARVGAQLEGVTPIILEPVDGCLEPGELILFVDDIVASHQRTG